MDIKIKAPDDGTVFHKRKLLFQIGQWKFEIKKQERRSDQ